MSRSNAASSSLGQLSAAKIVDGVDVPIETVGGLPIAVIDRIQSARLMVEIAAERRNSGAPPLVFTSANGQVLSMCAQDARIRQLFLDADMIHADGMPLVFASRLLSSKALPERVATTDLFHDVARIAEWSRTTFYMLGGTEIREAVRQALTLYPRLRICGCRSGYFTADQEANVIADINAAAPDILWIGMGVPQELEFALRNRRNFRGVGVIKTSGGLFDFVSGRARRAPGWLQTAGLEWAFRTLLEPQRLARRYITTNPYALFLLLTQTRRTGAPILRGPKIDAR